MALALAAIVAICPAGARSASEACAQPPPSLSKLELAKEPAAVPLVPFTDADDRERTLAGFPGKALVVNFWATFCAPCVKEMPSLDRLAGMVGEDGIVVLPLSGDREGAPVVAKFYAKNDIRHLGIAIDRLSKLARAMDVNGLPTTVLIDAKGQQIGRVVGEVEWDDPDAVAYLRKCLAPPA
jgi:thiol-disulfide isomerase/thioredoxin